MEAVASRWSFQELKAYLFLYAANSKYFETEEEKKRLRSIVDSQKYQQIHKEFDLDNDYQSIQKILDAIDKLNLNQKDLDSLLKGIRDLFDLNHKADLLEENMFLALRHLLHT